MILDLTVLADLAVAITPKSYVRVTPMAHAATSLGAGFGVTRFASPTKTFGVIYIVQDLSPKPLVATPVVEVTLLARFADALRELNVTLIATP